MIKNNFSIKKMNKIVNFYTFICIFALTIPNLIDFCIAKGKFLKF